MPLDDQLPPPRLPAKLNVSAIADHFTRTFGVVVDPAAFSSLPQAERLGLAGARLPEPPEAALLDRVLQLVPAVLLAPAEAILIVASRDIGRQGGARGGIVRVSAQEARLGEGDLAYGRAFSLFNTTVLHEIGHVVFARVLTDAQRERVYTDYMDELEGRVVLPSGAPSQLGMEHYFIAYLLAALLGRGQAPVRTADARQRMAALGLDLHVG
jgi:hypothetical protein